MAFQTLIKMKNYNEYKLAPLVELVGESVARDIYSGICLVVYQIRADIYKQSDMITKAIAAKVKEIEMAIVAQIELQANYERFYNYGVM